MRSKIFFASIFLFILSSSIHWTLEEASLSINSIHILENFWLLHLIAIASLFLGILYIKEDIQEEDEKSQHTITALSIIKKRPIWMLAPLLVLIFYMPYSFMSSMSFVSGSIHETEDGKYTYSEKGKNRREASEKEYILYITSIFQSFSGIWMVFFLGSAILVYPFYTNKDHYKQYNHSGNDKEFSLQLGSIEPLSYHNRRKTFFPYFSIIFPSLFVLLMVIFISVQVGILTGGIVLLLYIPLLWFACNSVISKFQYYLLSIKESSSGSIEIEYLDFDDKKRLEIDTKSLGVSYNSMQSKGGPRYSISFYEKGNLFFSQEDYGFWNPERIKALYFFLRNQYRNSIFTNNYDSLLWFESKVGKTLIRFIPFLYLFKIYLVNKIGDPFKTQRENKNSSF